MRRPHDGETMVFFFFCCVVFLSSWHALTFLLHFRAQHQKSWLRLSGRAVQNCSVRLCVDEGARLFVWLVMPAAFLFFFSLSLTLSIVLKFEVVNFGVERDVF